MSASESGGYAVPVLVLVMVAAVGVVGATVLFTDVPNPLSSPGQPDARELSMNYDGRTAIVTFEGGQRVPAGDALVVRVEGGDSWTWAELDADVKANDPIDAGETVAVTMAEPGDQVTVLIRDGQGAPRRVASWTV